MTRNTTIYRKQADELARLMGQGYTFFQAVDIVAKQKEARTTRRGC